MSKHLHIVWERRCVCDSQGVFTQVSLLTAASVVLYCNSYLARAEQPTLSVILCSNLIFRAECFEWAFPSVLSSCAVLSLFSQETHICFGKGFPSPFMLLIFGYYQTLWITHFDAIDNTTTFIYYLLSTWCNARCLNRKA